MQYEVYDVCSDSLFFGQFVRKTYSLELLTLIIVYS